MSAIYCETSYAHSCPSVKHIVGLPRLQMLMSVASMQSQQSDSSPHTWTMLATDGIARRQVCPLRSCSGCFLESIMDLQISIGPRLPPKLKRISETFYTPRPRTGTWCYSDDLDLVLSIYSLDTPPLVSSTGSNRNTHLLGLPEMYWDDPYEKRYRHLAFLRLPADRCGGKLYSSVMFGLTDPDHPCYY